MNEFDTPEGRAWLVELLQKNTATVSFTKKNGERRDMTCTLNFDVIPAVHHPKPLAEGVESKPKSKTALSVYDVNADGWRSFLWSNVLEVQFSLLEETKNEMV